MITVTRRYRFSASHRLHIASLSEAENNELYGKCNNPYGHGHDYILEVTCTAEMNPDTGLVLNSRSLDRLVEQTVLADFSFRDFNRDVPEFVSLVPTTENIAAVIVSRLQSGWGETVGQAARLCRIHLQETDRNGFEIII